ncbi:MAG: class I tRNA ligase family protein [Chitinivibrionales bacterium]
MTSSDRIFYPLYLTNTLTRKKEKFRSEREGQVKMFTCGPSVYKNQHLGNYRTFLYEDILQRYLSYLGYDVQRVINFTDVEDKAIEQAHRRGIGLDELTAPVIERFFSDARKLRIALPEFIPRATNCADSAAHIIKVLLDKGHVYRLGPDAYFDPLTFEGFGKLFGLDMSRWPKKRRLFGEDTYPGQRWNLGDFIVWHGCKGKHDICWNTEIGHGRPSWNIQDPAMILQTLGTWVDISCGGVDNLYRHHDYTIAIMESYSNRTFANYWLHGEHLFIDGQKMSKTKGNVLSVQSLIDQGYTPQEIRFFLTYSQYRRKLNITTQTVSDAGRKRERILRSIRDAFHGPYAPDPKIGGDRLYYRELLEEFEQKMSDDLDVQGTIDAVDAKLQQLAEHKRDGKLGEQVVSQFWDVLARIDQVLQLGLSSVVQHANA